MTKGPARNDPCRCGSGKKYKKCCMRKEHAAPVPTPAPPGEYRFGPGSYGTPGDGFFPAIACLKSVGADEWDYHFLLVNPGEHLGDQGAADAQAEHDLNMAFAEKQRTGLDLIVAKELRSAGYVSVNHFEVIPDDEPGMGWRPASDEPQGNEELGYDPQAQQMILEVVENQLRDNDPPETRETLARLLQEGHTQRQAKKLIAILVASEIYHMLNDQRKFDQDGYIAALRRLPTLPEELRED